MNEYKKLLESENPYGDLIAQEKAQALQGAMSGATMTQPDVEAKLQSMAGRLGVVPESLRNNIPEAERQVNLRGMNYDQMARELPVATDFLAENAAIASDDIEPLSGLERTWKAFTSGIDRGSLQDELGPLHFKALTGNITPAEQAKRKELTEAMKANQSGTQIDGPLDWFLNLTGYTGRQMASSLREGAFGAGVGAGAFGTTALIAGQAGPQIALPEEFVTVPAATLFGARAGFISATTVFNYQMEAGFAYDEYENLKDESGELLPRDVAQGAAAAVGLLNAGLETIGDLALAKLVPGLDRLLGAGPKEAVKELLKQPTFRAAIGQAGRKWAQASTVNGVTEALQELTVILGREVSAQIAGGEFNQPGLMQDAERIAQAGVEGAVGAAGVSIPASSIQAYSNVKQVQRLRANQAFMDSLAEGAGASKLRERMPEKFRDLVAKLKERGPVDSVYIPAEQFEKYFQSVGVDPAQVAEQVGATNYREAQAAGTDVVISLEDYTTYLAATEHHAKLTSDIRLHQGDLTQREYEAFEQERKEREAELMAAMEGDMDAAQTPAFEQIKQAMVGEFAGRFEPSTVDAYATTFAKAMVTMAQRATKDGIDPLELANIYDVRIQTPLPDILSRAGQGVDTAFDPLLDRLRTGDIPGEREAMGQSLAEFIRDAGGLKPSEEVLRLDESMQRGVGQRKLAQLTGMTVDQALEAAIDAGYLQGEELTEADLLNALADDVGGQRVFSAANENQELAGLRQSLLELQDYLDSLGADVTTMDNAAIKQMVDEASQRMTGGAEFAQTVEIDNRNLVALHNIGPNSLVAAAELGGLPVPSIGATRADTAYSDFGEISLIGLPELVDPQNDNLVFAGDAYTPTFPAPAFVLAPKKEIAALRSELQAIIDPLKAEYHNDPLYNIDYKPNGDDFRNKLRRTLGVMAKFLQDKGVEPKIVYKGDNPELAIRVRGLEQFADKAGDRQMLARNPEFQAAVREQFKANYIARGATEEQAQARVDGLGEDGTLRISSDRAASLQVFRDQQSGAKKIDHYGTLDALEAQIKETGAEDFDAFVEGFVSRAFPDRFIENKRGKAVPLTLENVLEQMIGRARGQEKTLVQGTGKTKALIIDELKSMADLKSRQDKIVSPAEYAEAAKNVSDLLDAYREEVAQFYRFEGDTFAAMNDAMLAVAKLAKGKITEARARQSLGSDFRNVPDYVIGKMVDSANALKAAPVKYFESKPQRAVGLSEFKGAVIPSNTPKAARDVLANNGIEVAEYEPGDNEARQQAVATLSKKLDKDTGGKILFQRTDDDKRGFIQIAPNRKITIALLEKANLSTFLHEMGHFHLEVLGDLAERPDASEQIKQDYQTLLDWFGVKSRAEIGTEQHEIYARANEAYLMEGKAPSAELRGVFQRFRAWLNLIYRSITSLNVRLNDDVRGVFDRIYATDAEIEAASREMDLQPLFTDAAAANMTDAEFAAYKKNLERATNQAKEDLQTQLMAEYERERQKWWKEQSAKTRLEVAAEIDAQPVYRAFVALTAGSLPDGTAIKLDKSELVRRYGKEFLKRLPKKRNAVYGQEGGTDLETAAEVLGFDNGDQLVQALANMRDRNELVKAETERRMYEQFGEMRIDGTITEKAMVAMHNESRADVLAIELRALNRLRRIAEPVVRARERADRAQAQAALDIPPIDSFRQAARGLIGQKSAAELNPFQYLTAQRRASRKSYEAAAKKDYQTAAIEKQREMMNHFLYLEAVKAKARVDKIFDYQRKFDKTKTRQEIGKAGNDYLDQIDQIRSRFEFARVTLAQLQARKDLITFAEEQEQQGLIVNVPDVLLNDARRVNYKQLTVDELNGVYDTLRNIEHLARMDRAIMREGERVEFESVRDELVQSAVENWQGNTGELTQPNRVGESAKMKGAKAWRNFDASLIKVEQMVQWLDGGKINGPWARFVFDLADKAQTKEYELHEKVSLQIQKLNESMPKAWQDSLVEKTKAGLPGFDGTLTRYTLISMALNTGNESNYQRLRDGYGWSDAQIEQALQELTADDWRFVQGVWDAVESLWPDIVELEKRMSGVAPPKVQPKPFKNQFGEFRGGYFPLAYDPNRSSIGEKQADATQSVAQFMGNGFGRASTDKGYTKQRVATVKAALELDFERVLTGHLAKVIKDISHRESIYSLNKIFSDGQIRETMISTVGEARYREFKRWMQGLITDRTDTLTAGNTISRWAMQFRTNMAIVTMGWKISTMLAQFAGFGPSMDLVKPRYLSQAMIDYNRHGPVSKHKDMLAEFVYERSGEMKFRTQTMERDVKDALRRMRGEDSPLNTIRKTAFYLVAMADRQVTIPTWLGAYRQAIAEGLSEEDAIRSGDRAVRLSQAAGGAKDLAAVQRDNEFLRLITMYYSPFSVLYARLRDVGVTTKRVKDLPRAVARLMALVILPAVVGDLLTMKGPDEDEDEVWWAVRRSLMYPFASIPLVRDASSYLEAAFIGLTDEGEMKFPPAFKLSPIVGAMDKLARLTFQRIPEAIMGERPWDDVAWDSLEMSGYVLGLPTQQVRISGEYVADVLNDEAEIESPQQALKDLLFRRDEK